MTATSTEALAAALLDGTLGDATRWDLGGAAAWIDAAIARHDATITAAKVRTATAALNERLFFGHSRRVGQAWLDARGFDPAIAKRVGQALVELSAFDAAEALLRDAIARVEAAGTGLQGRVERLEYEGLLGRVEKQRFVVSRDPDALARATERYLAQYEQPAKPYWHGINAVALLAREEREGLPTSRSVTSAALAPQILDAVARKYAADPSDVWLPATASEACLAIGDGDRAEFWLYRLLHHPQARAFHVNSYQRQLQEIWQASPLGGGQSCADRLATIIMRHVMKTESRWAISAPDLVRAAHEAGNDADGLEKNFTNQYGFSLDAIKRMLDACGAIGCVTNATGERLGTGFLVNAAALDPALAGSLFITNAHVISDVVGSAIPPARAQVTFEVESMAAGSPRFYKVGEVVFTSPPGAPGQGGDALDVSVVRLAGLPESHPTLSVAPALPLIDARARAYVVGHPRGSGLQVSLHDSLLLDVDDSERLVHYRTPTDPGSSGSPVFTRQWDVMAVHHSGSSKTPRLHGEGFYEANEGIALTAVRKRLAGR